MSQYEGAIMLETKWIIFAGWSLFSFCLVGIGIGLSWGQTAEALVLLLHIKFDISQQKIQGYVALMMDIPSLAQLRALIGKFVESLAGRPIQ
jgi:hypothetical protein